MRKIGKPRMQHQPIIPFSNRARANTCRLGLVIACIGFVQACAPITQLPQNMPTPNTPSQQSPSSPPSGLPTPPSPAGSPSSPAPSGLPSPPSLPSPPGLPPPAGEPGTPGETSGNEQRPSTEPQEDGTSDPGGEPGWLEDLKGGPADDWQTSNKERTGNNGEGEKTDSGDPADDSSSSKSAAEKELKGALEDFDSGILAERGALKKSADNSPAAATGPGLPQGNTQSDANEESRNQQSRTRFPNRPPPPRRGSEPLPDDIPDAQDDDIIARQLREAALQESDPELKEKIWAEYQRYKKG